MWNSHVNHFVYSTLRWTLNNHKKYITNESPCIMCRLLYGEKEYGKVILDHFWYFLVKSIFGCLFLKMFRALSSFYRMNTGHNHKNISKRNSALVTGIHISPLHFIWNVYFCWRKCEVKSSVHNTVDSIRRRI